MIKDLKAQYELETSCIYNPLSQDKYIDWLEKKFVKLLKEHDKKMRRLEKLLSDEDLAKFY